MSDPAIEAVKRAIPVPPYRWMLDEKNIDEVASYGESAAREALKPIRAAMAVIKERYDLVHGYMIAAETSAETSRHASELAGLMFAYNAIAPSVFTSEESAQ